jgi:SAM-dependent methyltransferase
MSTRRSASRLLIILSFVIDKTTPEHNHKAVVEHYARLAPKYDARWDRYTQRTLSTAMRQIDAALPAQHSGRLLDVACGTGRLAEMLLRQRPEVRIMGVDLSPEMIEVARHRMATAGDGRLEWHVAPAEDVPAADGSFDVVACNNAFHLIPDATAALREFHRVLKPGGRLVIVDWCREFLTIAGLLAVTRPFDRQARRVETLAELAARIERAGFCMIHRERFRATWFWGLMCVAAEKSAPAP